MPEPSAPNAADQPLAPAATRFTGFADLYDRHRPTPPDALASALLQVAGNPRLSLVVDLGSGTGLSTRYWVGKSREVIGIEPSPDMRAQALRHALPGLSYRSGASQCTGLGSACAQVVVCMQSLHWMDPQPTFEEARRILVPGGLFAAVDYDWPPFTGSCRADQAWRSCFDRLRQFEQHLPAHPRQWDKSGHLERMRSSGCFRYVRELLLHHWDRGDAERHIGLLRSQGTLQDLLKAGHGPDELGLPGLEAVSRAELGATPAPWLWCARVRIGVI